MTAQLIAGWLLWGLVILAQIYGVVHIMFFHRYRDRKEVIVACFLIVGLLMTMTATAVVAIYELQTLAACTS